jgi:glutamate-1-semialdehyde 2,1-aminomutase
VNDIAHRHGAVTIYDEVVTGFRYAPGGCQEYYGVTPDMTTLAKILAGGFPGGAVVGKAEILDILEFRHDQHWMRYGRIRHPGTFNASPVSAAAGVACLEIARTGEPQRQATATAGRIRAGIDDVLSRRGVPGGASGDVSQIVIRLPSAKVDSDQLKYSFRMAMQLGGVDVSGLAMIVSSVHTDADVDQTLSAFDGAIEMLASEEMI